jgi:hypothetical protein
MTDKQTKVLIIALVVIGAVLFTNLVHVGKWGFGCAEPIITWRSDGHGLPHEYRWGLWSCYGFASILFGIVVPLCLFAWASLLAVGALFRFIR